MSYSVDGPAQAVGRTALSSAASVGKAGLLALGALRALRRGGMWAPHLLGQMARIGVDSVPIALFIAAFTGVVLALQASYTFTGAIPLYFVGTLVGKTMVLELGPVLTGLALSGRVGANIAAELGTMRVTEQVDALETLAYDPIAYLVVPRVIAGALMFPVVVLLADAMGVLAGWGTSLFLLDMSSHEFLKGLRLFFQPWDVWFSVIKSVAFGLTVTSVGCFFGFHTTGGAEGVGRSTTHAVVASSMIILVIDAFLAAALL
ncbi:MAG: ABC transporter permease [Longimicrobiales bacterium]|nr:ABC transporter permease [Longimicrobiales bacterium]